MVKGLRFRVYEVASEDVCLDFFWKGGGGWASKSACPVEPRVLPFHSYVAFGRGWIV